MILVMGHSHCGAIMGAINGVEMGNLTTLLDKIKPAIAKTNQTFKGEQSCSNEAYVQEVILNNIKVTIDNIREQSPVLREMEMKGEIQILGALNRIDTA